MLIHVMKGNCGYCTIIQTQTYVYIIISYYDCDPMDWTVTITLPYSIMYNYIIFNGIEYVIYILGRNWNQGAMLYVLVFLNRS
jgi:hypothetical protein